MNALTYSSPNSSMLTVQTDFSFLFPQYEAIRLFCGTCEDEWSGESVEIGNFACVSPVYGRTIQTKSVNVIRLSPNVKAVIQDSGAFCDGPGQRLSFEAARKRQIIHAEKYLYASKVAYRFSYDVLIDEKWHHGQRYKQRWTEGEAWEACAVTIQAAGYLSRHRDGIPCILCAQGVSAAQYLKCVQGILPHLQSGDVLGLGGWCVLGKFPRQIMPAFREMLHQVIPFVGQEGVTRIHIPGCLYAPALGELLYLCDQHGITVSTDSVGPSLRPVFGRWGYASWSNPAYQRAPRGPMMAHHRRIHTYLVRRWLRDFRERERRYYRWCPIRTQHRFFEEDFTEAALHSKAASFQKGKQ
ncbi:MAG: hypothetical protein H0U76_22335 [Ktedonobacteraceae bacterium]|nr:hypothetical protein [Ktedonobacteraceae bacterium]